MQHYLQFNAYVARVFAFTILHLLLLMLLLLAAATNMFRFLIAAISRLTASFMPTQHFPRTFQHSFCFHSPVSSSPPFPRFLLKF